jgi:hypothetical protein
MRKISFLDSIFLGSEDKSDALTSGSLYIE